MGGLVVRRRLLPAGDAHHRLQHGCSLGGAFEQGTAAGKALWAVAAISAVATLVTGAVSRLRFKDHSVVVTVATIYGVLATTLLTFGAMPQY